MSALGNVGLQDSATSLLASQTDQTAGPSDLTPFCGKLNIDEKLKLSRENFKQLIEEFYKDKDITPLGQLTATPGFPHTLHACSIRFQGIRRLQKRGD
jgi:hypothetical protein